MASQSKAFPITDDSLRPLRPGRNVLEFLSRAAIVGLLFAIEIVAICYRFDGDIAEGLFRHGGAAILRGVVAFAVLLGALGYVRSRNALQKLSAHCTGVPIDLGILMLHFCVMAAFGLVSSRLFPHHPFGIPTMVLGVGWLALGLMAVSLAAVAFAPPLFWVEAFRATGNIWIYALGGGILAPILGFASQFLWEPATNLTFILVRSVLSLFVGDIHSDAATRIIGTSRFAVEIAPRCSGLEGAGLMIVVGSLWLWIFRGDFRFPRAVSIIPVGVAALYLLNAVRIAALILIGNAGAPEIAEHGFHSQAGWIAFNAVAVCLLIWAPRVAWLGRSGARTIINSSLPHLDSADPNSAYLVPLIVILVTAMLTRAATAQFEWLYPLRFVAAAGVLWHYRDEYKRIDWSFSGFSVFVGVGVLGMWLALDRWFGVQGDDATIGLTLAHASAPVSVFWIAIRVIAATVTVPIAEELAFRGYLLRRIVSPAFASVKNGSVTPLALVLSSLAFGVLHGDRWLAGALAGMLYAFAYLRRGRIGDAVVAHATTNALLAVYVVMWGKWALW